MADPGKSFEGWLVDSKNSLETMHKQLADYDRGIERSKQARAALAERARFMASMIAAADELMEVRKDG